MSVPALISPLLDGFVMGEAISDHHGVRCCPAMRTADESRYIVKIISVPASRTQLDALLLAGAFSDPQSALTYFKELSQDIVEEAVLLQRLSRLEGFLPYENWQVVPMEDGTGYDVYLLAPYRPTLERLLQKEPMTHLGIVNLGLDLCAALAACRRSGYLYADLRPGNICICPDREYRICDLGFLSLASLSYTSMPERYLSAYTAPEISDAYSALQNTMDTYALGRILYQACNGGELPEQIAEPPAYADSDLSQIILKACAADPAERWEDPVQMGQALVSYLQSHNVNDIPIVPPAPEPQEEPPAEEEATGELPTEDILAEVDQALEEAGVILPAEDVPTEAEPASEETPEAEAPEEGSDEEAPAEEESDTEEASAEEAPQAEPQESQESPAGDWEETLAAADDLIAHELPEPVVVPEPIEVTLPEPEPEEAPEESAPEPEDTPADPPEEAQPEDALLSPEEEVIEEDTLPPEPPRKKRKFGKLIALLIALVLLLGAGVAGHIYYNEYYLQTVRSLELSGSEDRLVVTLDTQVDNSLLSILCSDSYGNTFRQSVRDNTATFTGLSPNTVYRVHVQIEGFHKLIGDLDDTYNTPDKTVISGLNAVTGAEDGSVILSFTVQGPDATDWKIFYSCEGEAEKSQTFTGHMVTVTGLTPGKDYTFRVAPATELYTVGEDSLVFTASKLVFAQDLQIQSFRDGKLTAVWQVPEGATVTGWTVRCFSDAGFDKTVTVTDPVAAFEDLDPSYAYTVQVTAFGMTQSVHTAINANAVTVENIRFDESVPGDLTVTWDFAGAAPNGGWLVFYTATGYPERQVIKTDTPTALISPAIPGTAYEITIACAEGNTVFGGTASFQAAEAPAFSDYLVSAEDFVFLMCPTPDHPAWGQYDVPESAYTTTFAPGANASFAIFLIKQYDISEDSIESLVVIRDSSGNVLDTLSVTRTWTQMWYQGFSKLDLEPLPSVPGSYTAEVYYNGAHVTTHSFTIA